jgi:hypothetical protein
VTASPILVIVSPTARESSSGRSVTRATWALGTTRLWPGRIGNVSVGSNC